MITHLSAFIQFLTIPSLIGPLVAWLVWRDRHPYLDDQGKEALNFNISVLLYGVVLVVGGGIFGVLTLGLGFIPVVFLALALGIFWFVLVIVAATRANTGETYRYPLTIRFLR